MLIGHENVTSIATLAGSKGTLAHGRWLSGNWVLALLTVTRPQPIRARSGVRPHHRPNSLTAVDQSTWMNLARTGTTNAFQGIAGAYISSFGFPALGADDGSPAFATLANLATGPVK
jgi:hypothetical protein